MKVILTQFKFMFHNISAGFSKKTDQKHQNVRKIMKNKIMMRFAVVSISYCLLMMGVLTVNAHQTSNSISGSNSSDNFDDSPCKSYPKQNVFDDFEKAFRSPEKVKCLSPNSKNTDVKMKRFSSKIGTLVNLEVFSFGCFESLETLPEEIGNLSKLEKLIIDNGNGCSMSVSLPRSIGKLKNLKVLRLYGAIEANEQGKVQSLPDTIVDLNQLEVLDLGRNGLEAVPPQIAVLTNLKTLRLEYNNLSSIPEFIGDFKNLKELSLDSNGTLNNLPASLAKLSGLKISMGNNSLKLKDQKSLRSRFPQIVFTFTSEFDDDSANEEPPKPRKKSSPKHKR